MLLATPLLSCYDKSRVCASSLCSHLSSCESNGVNSQCMAFTGLVVVFLEEAETLIHNSKPEMTPSE